MTNSNHHHPDVEQRLDDWGHNLAQRAAAPMPPALAHAVAARRAQAVRTHTVLWRIGGGLALAASLAIVAIIALRTGPTPPVPGPTPIATAKPGATSPFTLLALARANRGADPDQLILPDLPRTPSGDGMRLWPVPSGG